MGKEKNNPVVPETLTEPVSPEPVKALSALKCRTISPNKSFIRCGVRWTNEWQDEPAGFTPEQIARLRADRMLQVK